MWNPHRTAEGPCHLLYVPVTSMKTFPLPIINKVSRVDNALREWGLPGIEICGDRITARDAGQECTFRPYSWSSGDRDRVTTRSYGDKAITIACMCVLIVLWQEGYIEKCDVRGRGGNFDLQNTILWQTAWGIIMDMEAKNENN